jgi:ABC-type Zn uptake system ZnuABC Zn-binding protein ZnuA
VRNSVRLLFLGLCLLAATGLQAAPVKIVATIPPYAMLAEAVAGEAGKVHTLVTRGHDPHHYDPTVRDMARLHNADVVIHNGIGQQRVESHLDQARQAELRFAVADAAPFQAIRDERGATNGHIWLDPDVMIRAAAALATRLAAVHPDAAATFADNAAGFIAAVQDADETATDTLSGLSPRRVVTYHPGFDYFFRHYGITVSGTYLDLSGNEPSGQALNRLLERIRAEAIPALFLEPQLPKRPGRALAREAGIRLGVLDPLGFDPAISSYPELLRYNARQVARTYAGEGP